MLHVHLYLHLYELIFYVWLISVNEWRSKWHLTGQYEDSNPDDLIRDMSDIQDHVRLKAVATIGKAAEYHPPVDPGIQLEYQTKLNDPVTQIPPRLFVALDCMLEDSCDKIRKAAAITLFSLNKPSDKVRIWSFKAFHS